MKLLHVSPRYHTHRRKAVGWNGGRSLMQVDRHRYLAPALLDWSIAIKSLVEILSFLRARVPSLNSHDLRTWSMMLYHHVRA